MEQSHSPKRTKYVVLDKPIGQTPLETIDAWKNEHTEYNDVAASYAGRLDPMASGKLLVLLGEECKKQADYTKLDKEYEIEVVLDLSTDTGDTLGLPIYAGDETSPNKSAVQAALCTVRGSHQVPYPAFSSKTVQGKPLFLYALEGALDSIPRPMHTETIYRIQVLEQKHISRAELQERIRNTLTVVPRSDEPSKVLGADFRQDAVRAAWTTVFEDMPERSFVVLRLRVTCASGTYMRSLAERIASALGTNGLALSIKRTRIGRYQKILELGWWLAAY
ncbi:MAG: hypothetical protein AAB901_02615 [Patescibacteria group bacterium]